MKALYDLQEKIRVELQSNKLINSVTFGDLFDIDLQKHSIFPLAHVGISTGTINVESGTAYINVSILFLDVVDETKKKETDHYYGNDNESFVFNSMFVAASKTVAELSRGSLYSEGYQVEENVAVEFFSERFENKLAGCGIDFPVLIKNTIDLC